MRRLSLPRGTGDAELRQLAYRPGDVTRRIGARLMGLRLRDGRLIVKFVRGRRMALFRVVDGDGFDPARDGLAIAACTGRDACEGGRRPERLDAILVGR